MEIISGNILNIEKGIICHQVNCRGVMGAGIALQIRRKWPSTYTDYRSAFSEGLLFLGNVVTSKITQDLYVAHMCGQDRYGRNRVYTDYTALATCMDMANVVAAGRQIYIPYGMGCGFAGGNWNIVSDMVERLIPKAVIVRLG